MLITQPNQKQSSLFAHATISFECTAQSNQQVVSNHIQLTDFSALLLFIPDKEIIFAENIDHIWTTQLESCNPDTNTYTFTTELFFLAPTQLDIDYLNKQQHIPINLSFREESLFELEKPKLVNIHWESLT